MTKEVISVTEETSVRELAEKLFESNITGMPVLDKEKRVVGIISEHDLLSRNEKIHIPSYIKFVSELKTDKASKGMSKELAEVLSLKARDIMTTPVVTITPETLVQEAARIFTEEHINPLPVVDAGGQLQGILSRADLVKLFKHLPVDNI